jgi:hypothetical protein
MDYKVEHAIYEQPSGFQSCGEAWDMDVRREARYRLMQTEGAKVNKQRRA